MCYTHVSRHVTGTKILPFYRCLVPALFPPTSHLIATIYNCPCYLVTPRAALTTIDTSKRFPHDDAPSLIAGRPDFPDTPLPSSSWSSCRQQAATPTQRPAHSTWWARAWRGSPLAIQLLWPAPRHCRSRHLEDCFFGIGLGFFLR